MDDKEKNLISSENLNSQNNVGSFPLHNNTFVNSTDKSDINNRINNTKNKNLQNNMESRETSNTSLGADSLEKKDKLDKGSLGKNALNSAGNALLNKASEDDGIVGDTAKGIRAVNKGVKATKTSVKAIKALITLLSGPVGWVLGIFAGVMLLIFLIVIVYHTIISSLSMKFNLTGKDSYEVFKEKYEEAMSRGDIDSLYESADGIDCGERSYFTKIKNFFGIYEIENPTELCLYVKKKLEEKETLPGITTLSPGYFLSSLYYAYDTQNVKENGELFIKVPDASGLESDDKNYVAPTDLDAISTLFVTKIYEKEDLDKLIDEYILKYDLEDGYGLTPYKLVIDYDEKGNEIGRHCDAFSAPINYQTSESKFNLYLRYGENISESYQKDNNIIRTYELTSSECYDNIGVAKPSLAKYDVKLDLTSEEEKIPSIDGYTYEDGFIYDTYPRYKKEYNLDGVKPAFDYKVARDIENIMDSRVSSRQDYINYLLGYPNTVKTNLALYSGNCTYTVGNRDVSNLKVRLIHKKNSALPDVEVDAAVPNQELIDFEKYVLGVVYAENGGAPDEAMKAQAIAARTYAFNRGTIKEENGEVILEISSSTWDQTYCDPDKGCDICTSALDQSVQTVMTKGTVPEGASCTHWKGPLENDSRIRKAVKAVSGIILTDTSENPAGVGYTSTTQNSWNSLANQGSDYVELLRSSYGGEYILSNPSCSFASGDWDKWRQSSSEWGSIMLSTKNMSSVGCFITAHAKAIAKSGAQVKVANFNPGTFVNTIKANGCLNGNNLVSACALKSVLVNDYERKSSALSGSLENKANVIAGYINNGYEVILRVKSPDPRQHWVLVTGVSGSTIYMSDTASDANIVVPFYNANEVVYMIAYRFDI